MIVELRPLVPADREPLHEVLVRTEAFTPVEVDCALELIDAVIGDAPQSDYLARCAVDEQGVVLGYVCYGPVPLTSGTYDLYWIAVDPLQQRRGVGAKLMDHAEAYVIAQHGRQLLVQTSSQSAYAATHAFYAGRGYTLAARLDDYYSVGDAALIYRKVLRDG